MPTKYADTDYTQFFTAATKPVLTGFTIDKKTGDVSATFNHTVNIRLDSDRITSLQAEALLNMTPEKPEHISGGTYQKFLKAWAKFRRKLSTFKKIYKGKPFDRIVFSGPCTILTGDHNEKTIVRCGDMERYDPEKAVLAALFIREYGKPAFTFLMESVDEEYLKSFPTKSPEFPLSSKTYMPSGSESLLTDFLKNLIDDALKTTEKFKEAEESTDGPSGD